VGWPSQPCQSYRRHASRLAGCAIALKFCDKKRWIWRKIEKFQASTANPPSEAESKNVCANAKPYWRVSDIRAMFGLEAQDSPGALTTKTKNRSKEKI
jgi:hypothetical protein